MDGPSTVGTADFGSHQGQVGHGGSQVQMEPGFDAAEVASVADSQRDQTRQPVLHHYPPMTVPVEGLTLLQGAGLLQ